jgi:hypothetical protein
VNAPPSVSSLVALALIGTATAATSLAAPAPLPRRQSPDVEVVFDAGTEARARQVAWLLGAPEYLAGLAYDRRLFDGADVLAAGARLRGRLSVTPVGYCVRVRAEGASASEILAVITEQLTGEATIVTVAGSGHPEVYIQCPDPEGRAGAVKELAQFRLQVAALRARGGVTERTVDLWMNCYELVAEPLKLVRGPGPRGRR